MAYDPPLQTAHGARRMAQRRLNEAEIEYVMLHGARYRRAGVLHFYLRKKDIPTADRRFDQYSRLEGTVVLLDSRNGTVMITAYRNRRPQALKAIRRKTKYNRKPWARRWDMDKDDHHFALVTSQPHHEDGATEWE